ncbi:MAG: PIN domain-containing protein [Chthoniobacterales bacterium]|nr:PIN domain-containing protein [Chthoniobacterales bacterium]
MNFLLDVNVLVAWGWSDHTDHDRVVRWIAGRKKVRNAKLFTSPIPEIGFVRVSIQRSSRQITVSQAADVLRGMLKSLGAIHQFLPDDLTGTEWPAWCASATNTTDAHLLELAKRHGLHLATLDAGIPGGMALE